MITDCEALAGSHGLKFNVSKTQLICFRRLSRPVSSCFWLCLGTILQFDLSDKPDIQAKTMTFLCKVNSVLFCFRFSDSITKMRLFYTYCLSFYDCALWRIDCVDLKSLSVSFNSHQKALETSP